jgi:hypothetical protein
VVTFPVSVPVVCATTEPALQTNKMKRREIFEAFMARE